MDRDFQMNANTFFSERHGSIVTSFRKENTRNQSFLCSMAEEKEQLKNLVSADLWQRFNQFIELLEIHSDIKSKYLYAQGIKDCVYISNYLDTEFINYELEEIWQDVKDM